MVRYWILEWLLCCISEDLPVILLINFAISSYVIVDPSRLINLRLLTSIHLILRRLLITVVLNYSIFLFFRGDLLFVRFVILLAYAP